MLYLLLWLLLMTFHPNITMSGRAQRKQRQADALLEPYLGRVDPASLCELLKCYSPVGSWCQVVRDGEVLVPKCVCPTRCPRQGVPVCSVQGKTYSSECLLHKEACRKRRRIGKAHTGACLVSGVKCSEQELAQFPYRLLDWFLLLSRMGEHYTHALTHCCLTHTERVQLAQSRFSLLDRNQDGRLTHRDLKTLQYKRMPMEHCAHTFFLSCDSNRNKKVSLREWTSCLVTRSERWFHNFMSVKMGSPALCPAADRNL